LHSPNPTLDGVAATICRQTEIFYAIMASTIPCLRPFLASFFTGFGAMGGETVIAGSQVGSGSHSRGEKGSSSYALGSMQSSSGDSSSATAAGTTKKKSEKRRSRSGQTTIGAYMRERERDNFGLNRQNHAQVSHETTIPSSLTSNANANSSKRTTMSTMMTMGAGPSVADVSSIASNDDESQRMIIKKEVQWHVGSEKGEDGRIGGVGVPRGL
jgi:hypothetical protein